MLGVLSDIFIMPIEYLMEIIFEAVYRLFGSVPLALFFLSLFVSTITLPLYLNAERLQKAEKDRQKSLDGWVKHIKRSFKGDERLMIYSYFRKIMGYSLIDSLKGVIPLFLQIPFFVAAYRYLSGSELLRQTVSVFLGNLGEPDTILRIWGVSIHVLPIIMTLINYASGIIYTRGAGMKDKLQVFIPALVFLVLLYPMPAGLVLYWTFNNVFSLMKNIYLELPEKARKVALYIPAACGVFIFLYSFVSGLFLGYIFSGKILQVVCIILIVMIFFIPIVKARIPVDKSKTVTSGQKSITDMLIPAFSAVIIMGAVVPLKLIDASPLEFVNIFNYVTPFTYVLKCLCVSAGAFIVWGSIVWLLLGGKGRNGLVKVMEVIALAFLLDYFVFGAAEGRVNSNLVFDSVLHYPAIGQAFNIILIIAVIGAVILIRSDKIKRILFMIIFGTVVMTALVDSLSIQKQLKNLPQQEAGSETLGILPLSRTGKNVIVLMLDRAISAYVPYIFAEKPELKEAFDGFTWYPNTLSHGGYTIFGMPSLFGGYEYTPKAMNEKDDKSIAEDLDEALKIMPISFGEEGWSVTVCDPPYAGFSEISDISIYDDLPYVKSYRLWGRYSAGNGSIDEVNKLTERNFVYYSLMEVLPLILRKGIYDDGKYLHRGNVGGTNGAFLDSYREMDALPEMSFIREDGNSFIMMANNITHSPQLLKKPEYEVSDGEGTADSVHMAGELSLDTSMHLGEEHYDVNMAAFIKLADWFDMMRAEGVYDNSRIIIVADHGYQLGQFEELLINDELDVEGLNPLFMVKDFNAKGFNVSDAFMTNADTPVLAMEDVIAQPVNPYSGEKIDMTGKKPYVYVTLSDKLSLSDNSGNIMDTNGASWYTVHDNLFQKENWDKLR